MFCLIGIVLKRAVEEYFSNFKVMLSFGVLFVFIAIFALFDQFFFSAGSVFFSLNSNIVGSLLGVIVSLFFLYFFSFFISLTVYSVHRDVQRIDFDTYWNTLFKDAAVKIFIFYLMLAVIFYVISYIGFVLGFSFYALLINLIIGLLVIFVPQSIVLDETSVLDAVSNSVGFLKSNFFVSMVVFLLITIALTIVIWVELYLQSIGFIGVIISFFLVLVVLVPFFEQAKSYAYLMRNDLLKGNEFVYARAPRTKKEKPKFGVRLREKPRKGSKI
ncbi:MAG: hypothetical protein BWY55_00096 [archaeon ADurb.Bin336]|nr:MAG: hypothetical protein BWY55_00096 [archaeon ADurb.Bin336]